MTVDWLIIGGGIHGVHIAARLLGEAGVAPDQLRIVDPADHLLARWRACTGITGMTHLRSPVVHHLDVQPWSLRRFGQMSERRESVLFAAPYDRPCLSLFNAHCDQVIDTFNLDDRHIHERAVRCSVGCDGVEVVLKSGRALSARHVVLAIGASEQPRWPVWAPRRDARVHHIFAPEFDGWPASHEAVTVVGGGISAGQVALRLLEEGHQVDLLSRHPLREHQFDSDSGWLGPKRMAGFRRERDVDRRRELITNARHQGSVPPDLRRALHRAIDGGGLRWKQGEVEWLDARGDDLMLRLTTHATIRTQRVLLATGFESRRPGGEMVDDLIASASLPCASCGFPVVDTALRWHPRVHVCGPLAELELGPTARNIAGARRAGDRLVRVARADASSAQKRAS